MRSESIQPTWTLPGGTAQIISGVDSDESAHGCAIQTELLSDGSDVHAFAAQRLDLGVTTLVSDLDATRHNFNYRWSGLVFGRTLLI
jgi:hypothetical protein